VYPGASEKTSGCSGTLSGAAKRFLARQNGFRRVRNGFRSIRNGFRSIRIHFQTCGMCIRGFRKRFPSRPVRVRPVALPPSSHLTAFLGRRKGLPPATASLPPGGAAVGSGGRPDTRRGAFPAKSLAFWGSIAPKGLRSEAWGENPRKYGIRNFQPRRGDGNPIRTFAPSGLCFLVVTRTWGSRPRLPT
jgi:hypothetical protein